MFGQDCFFNVFQNIQISLTTLSNRISTISNSLIPKNNLPIYLQDYTFSTSSSSENNVLAPYFNIVSGLSTNETYHRSWNLVTAGTLSSVYTLIIFTYDFSGVNTTYKVSLNGTLSGTFIINGQVYDAANYFKTPDYVNKILTLKLDLTEIPQTTNGGDFYYNIFLADGSCKDDCYGGSDSACNDYCTKHGNTGGECNKKDSKSACIACYCYDNHGTIDQI